MKAKKVRALALAGAIVAALAGVAEAGPRPKASTAKPITAAIELAPIYALVGARPVELVRTADGGLDVLAFDWELRMMARDTSLLTRLVTPDEEVELVSAARFGDELARLSRRGPAQR